MNRNPNSQYNVAAPDSMAIRLASFQRERMYRRFLDATKIEAQDTLCDVGVTSDQTYASSNYVEAWYPHKDKITAAGIDDAAFLERLHPGLSFVRADGLRLPFQNASFDVVHSSAVLEHVGGFANQVRFIAECARVSRKAAFLTTRIGGFRSNFTHPCPLYIGFPKRPFEPSCGGQVATFSPTRPTST
jgi:ubiquinone/menaquinone biosynthesis C-methylase UbiE